MKPGGFTRETVVKAMILRELMFVKIHSCTQAIRICEPRRDEQAQRREAAGN